ncbi:MAG: DUF2341 domain-containing protein, partial [Armatimonadia bacterium]|nr:DUF2341 domain-containing protein [Armatimonadia bacterium]
MRARVSPLLLTLVLVSSCTAQGAWDLFRDLAHGDRDRPGDRWFDDAWSRRHRLSFLNSGLGALTDFPLLVVLTNARVDYAATAAGGTDLRFVDADTAEVLDYEIERWTSGGTSYVWVKVPRIDAGSIDDRIWLYYGNPGT